MRFFLGDTQTLSAEQLRAYDRQGFLLVSGLIQRNVVDRARDVMLDRIRGKQSASHHAFIHDASVVACFSPGLRRAAAQLAGGRKAFARPRSTYTISVFPQNGSWQWPAPHIDHALERDAHRTLPPPFEVGCLIYLTDVSKHSGGTVVWPESHRQLECLAQSNPKEYEYLWAVNRDIPKIKLAEPLEILSRAGDVLFYHNLCAHAGSMNAGTAVRVALNHKW